MNKTQNYQLNQWDADDRVLRTDFNADNAKIDAALGMLSSGKGNCRIATGSYTGTGTFGANNPNSLTFPFQPLAVFLTGGGHTASLVAGLEECTQTIGMIDARWKLAWSGNTLSWYVFGTSYFNGSSYSPNANTQFNHDGTVYRWVAFGAAED